MPRDFHKLIAWKKADDLVVEIYRSSAVNFPREERYGLTQPLRRSAASVPSNLAEGSGRRTEEEFRQFLYVARASIYEVEYQLHLAARLGHVELQIKNRKGRGNPQVPRLEA